MSRRLEGKAATQARILAAATELFLEHGFERTTISAVAERAQVGRATVFWHFGDKGSLFREAFSRLLDPFRESLEQEFSELEPEKRLQEQLAMSEQFAQRHGREIAAFLRWALEDPEHRDSVVATLMDLNQRFAAALARSVSSLVPPEANPELLAQVLMLAFDGNLLLSLFERGPSATEGRRAAIHAYADLIANSNRKPTR